MMNQTDPREWDRALVKKLWECDSEAWEYIYTKAVIPVTSGETIYRMLQDFQLSRLDVLGMVYDIMICQKKLARYSESGVFLKWLSPWIIGIICKYCKKNARAVSNDKPPKRLPIDEGTPEPFREDLEVAQKCFSKLWRKNPMRAYVHLLWVKNGLSVNEIMQILGVSSVDNVYKMHSRAVQEMRELRSTYEKGEML